MNKTTIGTFFELGGRGAMESLSHTGLDYVIIDTEHGCFSEESTADYILAAEKAVCSHMYALEISAVPTSCGCLMSEPADSLFPISVPWIRFVNWSSMQSSHLSGTEDIVQTAPQAGVRTVGRRMFSFTWKNATVVAS